LSEPQAAVASGAVQASDREAAEESDRLHRRIGWLLRIGLGASVLLLTSGMIVLFATGVQDAPSVRLWHLDGDAGLVLSTLGVTVLALTPALRVVALVALWWRERDWHFVGVALAVVATLAVGIFLGKG
jgi:uncharacterized membrane protein